MGADFEEIDLGKGLGAAELDRLIGTRDHRDFLNPRNELYRELDLKNRPPSRQEAIRLMSENPNLIRRPLLVKGGRIVFGFDEAQYKDVAG